MSTQSVREAALAELEEVARFLDGAAPMEGSWFSDIPICMPRYWWRAPLREAVAKVRAALAEKGHVETVWFASRAALATPPTTEAASGDVPRLDIKKCSLCNEAGCTTLCDAATPPTPSPEMLALQRDAERYRWLRGGRARTTGAPKARRIEVYQWEDKSEGAVLKGGALDAAVDAARAAAFALVDKNPEPK